MRSRLKVVLSQRRMKACELADALGVHRETVYKWCTDKGVESMSLGTAKRVAAILGCRVSDIFEE